MKNIWILNHYAGDSFFSKNGRHYSFAHFFEINGYKPTVFCANSKHESKGHFFDNSRLYQEYTCDTINVPFVFVKARSYSGNGKARLMNMLDFFRNVKLAAKKYAKENGTPNIIYASSVHPLTLIAGLQLAKHFKVKCICEVRDLWPESIVVLRPSINRHKLLLKILYYGERWIYKKADAIVFTMEGGYHYIEDKGWENDVDKKKVFYVNNGVDLDAFEKHVIEDTIIDEDLQNNSVFKVVYTGSIRKANGLGEIVNCAELLKNEHGIKFLIYGIGEDLDQLREICVRKGVNNLMFKGKVENRFIPYILSHCNLNLLNYSPEVAKVFKYGSSQNKLFEYLASGKPILSDTKIEFSVVDKYRCGINKNISTAEEYADTIIQFYKMDKKNYEAMCENAALAAKEYNYKSLAEKMLAIVSDLEV
ncbi:MAG: glycosyltransferase family 4 protein [Mogibacterium sp.]|nr:glycosyltransferase family 4 protein [Mogibacterium sp.]